MVGSICASSRGDGSERDQGRCPAVATRLTTCAEESGGRQLQYVEHWPMGYAVGLIGNGGSESAGSD